MRKLTRDERSILLYLETCCVDHGGLCEGIRMNDTDFACIQVLKAEGVIEHFGRLPMKLIKEISEPTRNHFCILTELGFDLAHAARRARAEQRGTVATEAFEEIQQRKETNTC